MGVAERALRRGELHLHRRRERLRQEIERRQKVQERLELAQKIQMHVPLSSAIFH